MFRNGNRSTVGATRYTQSPRQINDAQLKFGIFSRQDVLTRLARFALSFVPWNVLFERKHTVGERYTPLRTSQCASLSVSFYSYGFPLAGHCHLRRRRLSASVCRSAPHISFWRGRRCHVSAAAYIVAVDGPSFIYRSLSIIYRFSDLCSRVVLTILVSLF